MTNKPLLDLPAELVSKILVNAVLVRGIRRAMRLRLVCKRLSQEIQDAVFESRLLDDVYTIDRRGEQQRILNSWYIGNDHEVAKFWHSYLVYRVQNETRKSPQRRYHNIRLVAERVRQETGTDIKVIIESICWPALQQGTSPPTNSRLEKELPNFDLDLLCAAAYLNLIPLAKQLLQQGHSPHSESLLFSSPMRLAAWAGNSQMLEIFQEHVPEIEDAFTENWKGKVGPASIYGAAIRGDMHMLRLAIYPPSRAAPESTDFLGQLFGSVDPSTPQGRALRSAQCYSTRNVDIYKHLGGFFQQPGGETVALVLHAQLGNVEMVQQLLDAGADIRGFSGRQGNPLIEACRRCHEDVVDLLLDRGADPNSLRGNDIVQYGYPLPVAAASGSLAIVRTLLSRGGSLWLEHADISMGFYTLHNAVTAEHTEMVRFLVAEGVDIGGIWGDGLLKAALARGLDSMVELLQGIGITRCCEEDVTDDVS